MLLSISDVFIKRPVLATVITLMILLIGGICIPLLPLEKLPQLAPVQIQVTSNYVGADAKTTTDNVTTILEKQINGAPNMLYQQSFTDSSGNSSINASFPVGTDPNTAEVIVQNRQSQATSQLPSEVQRSGVTVMQASPSITLVYAIYSQKDNQGHLVYDPLFLYNYADRFLVDPLRRIEGVGDIRLFGSANYAMRIWLDPQKLAARQISTQQVIGAINEQNIQTGAGIIGQKPNNDNQQYQIILRAKGRFETVQQAQEIVVQTTENGTLIKLKDIARVELGAQDYSTLGLYKGEPGVAMVVYQLPGTNALNTAKQVNKAMDGLIKLFPPGMEQEVIVDNTLFVTASLNEAIKTLWQAIFLVILVIFIFLQDWRITLIPAIAIPVSLIGSMAFLKIFGISLNQLTLFGVVLATGLVVDDAIIVVEEISTKIAQGENPKEAAYQSMESLGSAIIATSLVLMSVFIPVSFFPGTTGIIYKQFALTIIFSIAVSTLNALTFSPSIAAILLKENPAEPKGPVGYIFKNFNYGFKFFKTIFIKFLRFILPLRWLVVVIFVTSLLLTTLLYKALPQGFLPEEDQGYFVTIIQAPPGVSLNYTAEVAQEISAEALQLKEVSSTMSLVGFSFNGFSSNQAIVFSKLKDWQERKGEDSSVFGTIDKFNKILRFKTTKALAIAVNAPPADGLGSVGGFQFELENRSGQSMDALVQNAQALMGAAKKRPEIGGLFTQFTFGVPTVEITVDRDRAKAENVEIDQIFETIQTSFGSSYVNQFVLGNQLYRVYIQVDKNFRSNLDDFNHLYVNSKNGKTIPMNNLVKLDKISYPPVVGHFNIYPSVEFIGNPAPGYSSGDAIKAIEEVANDLFQGGKTGFWYELSGLSLQESYSVGAAPLVFSLAFVMVFLVLSAQYESYVDPLVIVLTVPLSVLGATISVFLRANIFQFGSVLPIVNNNIYYQVALVMLIGVTSKNAILVVEFANQAKKEGLSIVKSAIRAAKERLRPILMTAIAGLVGFLPLVVAQGAGAMSRWTMGTAIFGGYLIATLLSLVLAPILYIVIKTLEKDLLGSHFVILKSYLQKNALGFPRFKK